MNLIASGQQLAQQEIADHAGRAGDNNFSGISGFQHKLAGLISRRFLVLIKA
jgi:hypothetical protein